MASIAFVCPACKQDLEGDESAFWCVQCSHRYPVLFGIADFRLRSDRYLDLDEERAKARRLHAFSENATFDELLTYYYSITDDVPDALVQRYVAYANTAPERGAEIVATFGPVSRSDSLLDAGCGTGGLLLAAAGHFDSLVGVDIALRWLVICRRRLAEQGLEATLVCADVESLPFADGSFSHVVAADLVEHVHDPENALSRIARQLKSTGTLWLSATNKYCLGPHPLVRIWAVGFLPKPLRKRLVVWVRGVDSLRYVKLVSPRSIAASCRAHGLAVIQIEPLHVAAPLDAYPLIDRLLISVYRSACAFRALRYVLVLIGPAFNMHCRKQ